MKRQNGNTLILIVVLMASIGLAASAFFINFTSVATTGGSLFAHKRAFYTAEGTMIVVTKLAQNYLSETNSPDANELRQKLIEELPPLTPPNYSIEDIQVSFEGEPTLGPITSGTFKGMLAPQTTMRVSYNVKSSQDTANRPVIHMESTLSLAQVAMFQFLYFIDLVFADFSPGPIMQLNGRVHSNGDLCLSGALGLYVSRVTSAGRLMHGSDPRCLYQLSGDETFISSGPDLTAPVRLTRQNSNGCTSCAGGTLPWADYAPATWNGNALDSSHAVNEMVLPVPSNVNAQLGADGDDRWRGMNNTRNLRFIIDPVLTSDPDQVVKQKYSFKSTIRIINGVWYLKDPANVRAWPGLPIWSDHPGRATDNYGNAVGQDDIRQRWSTTDYRWPAGDTPRRFSYYEYNAAATSLRNDNRGVISYGNLYADTGSSPTHWRPGHWLDSTNGDRICPSGSLLSSTGLVDAFEAINCTSAGSPGAATALLNGTRAGIRDMHTLNLYPDAAERTQRARILPMNFDVSEFQLALLDTSPGELGSYFGPGRLHEEFNGVVFISSDWPGSLNGFSPMDQPTPPPVQGSNNSDTGQMNVTGPMQRELPQALCSEVAPSGQVGAGMAYDLFSNGGTPVNKFRIPDCALYRTNSRRAYVNAVRVVNGYALNPTQLTKGLSIVSNIGAYLQGEFNTRSNVTTESSTPWTPTMLAADQIVFLSNAWSDANSAWTPSYSGDRIAAPTTYNLGVLTGWSRQSNSMTLHAFPSMMEDWRTARITFNGSIVVGFYPTYERYGKFYASDGSVYRAGERMINYDKHFQYTANQPPGSPLFYISSLLDWKAE